MGTGSTWAGKRGMAKHIGASSPVKVPGSPCAPAVPAPKPAPQPAHPRLRALQ